MKKNLIVFFIFAMVASFYSYSSAQDQSLEPGGDGPGCVNFGYSIWTSSGPFTKDRTFYNCFCGKEKGIPEQACM
ncbi:hypothetical protein [Mongoliitalea daihaiensis]|uniref:hypothetical protein n=1 Tax=Mongoliitalea daihaiensis TaxID=2782006 RepID=UPI001F291CDA|nr:hypothetical protein [Mongoliitalea daihaiensis]UJP66516.1 hypothetical protein IPZ59_07935 [Mongoliitalea daihaiensis]